MGRDRPEPAGGDKGEGKACGDPNGEIRGADAAAHAGRIPVEQPALEAASTNHSLMFAALASTAVWLLLVVCVVVVGWNEPLRYKFMSRAQIVAEEKALEPPPPPPKQGPVHTDMRTWNGGTKLDGGSYRP